MRRVFGDTITTIGGVLLVLIVLVAFDDHVRDRVTTIVAGRPTVEIETAGEQAHDIALVIVEAARDQSIEHAPVMIFTLAATVLVLFMLRT